MKLKTLDQLLKEFPKAFFVDNGGTELILHKRLNIYLRKSLPFVGKETPYTDYYPFMIQGGPTFLEWCEKKRIDGEDVPDTTDVSICDFCTAEPDTGEDQCVDCIIDEDSGYISFQFDMKKAQGIVGCT